MDNQFPSNNDMNNNINQQNPGVDNNSTPVEPVFPGPIVQPEPVVNPEPVVQPEPIAQPQPVVEPEPIVAPAPVIEPQPAVMPEPVVQAPVQPEPIQPVIEPEPMPQTEPVMQPEPVVQPEPVMGPEPFNPVTPAAPIENQVPGMNAPAAEPKKGNNKILLFGIIGGVVLVAAVVAVLFIFVFGRAKIVLECTDEESLMGVSYKSSYKYHINDGEIAKVEVSTKYDLSESALFDNEESVNTMLETFKKECEKTGCSLSHKYKKGDSLSIDLKYDKKSFEKSMGSSMDEIKDLSADEIASKLEQVSSSMTCKR